MLELSDLESVLITDAEAVQMAARAFDIENGAQDTGIDKQA